MANHLRSDRVLDALQMAVGQRTPRDVIHHSGQGSRYTSPAFGNRCQEAGLRPSIGPLGDAYDNAPRGRSARVPGRDRIDGAAVDGRELLRHPRMRLARPPSLSLAGCGADGLLQLHRRPLQPPAPALAARLPLARRPRAGDQTTTINRTPAQPSPLTVHQTRANPSPHEPDGEMITRGT